VQDVVTVPASAGLDEVLAQLLCDERPVAVTGDQDEFIGMLSRLRR